MITNHSRRDFNKYYKDKPVKKRRVNYKYYTAILWVLLWVIDFNFANNNTLNKPNLSVFIFITSIVFFSIIKLMPIPDEIYKAPNIFSKALGFATFHFVNGSFAIILAFSLLTMSFDSVNYYYARKSPIETFIGSITYITKGSGFHGPKIWFMFKNKEESIITTSHRVFEIAKNNSYRNKLQMTVSVRKGLFDSYIVEDWDITDKNSSHN